MKRWTAIAVSGVVLLLVLALILAVVFKAAIDDTRFVFGKALPTGKVAPQISITSSRAVLLAPDGSLWAWGGNQSMSPTLPMPGTMNVPRRLSPNSDWRQMASASAGI